VFQSNKYQYIFKYKKSKNPSQSFPSLGRLGGEGAVVSPLVFASFCAKKKARPAGHHYLKNNSNTAVRRDYARRTDICN